MSLNQSGQKIQKQPSTVALEVVEQQQFDLKDPQYYLNREFSWLEFNRRVLAEAEREVTPLLERLKFLAIVSTNLDEFFMKRIGGLKQQLGAHVPVLSVDGLTPGQQVAGGKARTAHLRG